MLQNMLIIGVLMPAVISLILLLMFWRGQSPDRHWRPLWVPALALYLAFLTSWYFLKGLPSWPVTDSAGWLPWLAGAGALLGSFIAIRKLPPATVMPLRVFMSVTTVWLATQSLQSNAWKGQSWLWIAGLSLLMFIIWISWEDLARRHEGPMLPLLLTINFTALAFAALLGESASISQSAGIICAALGAMVIVGLIRPSLNLSVATLFVAMPLFAVMLLNAHFYANLSTLHAVLLLACTFAAPLAVRITAKYRLIPRLAAAALITALPFLVSVGLIMFSHPAVSADDGTDYYYDDYYGS